jgi:hypothetical protein
MGQRLLVKGILSYPHLFQPRRVNENSDPRYSTSILIAKNDPQISKLQNAIETEKSVGFPKGFPPKGTICLKDCVVEFPLQPELANYHVIPAGTGVDSKPNVVDMERMPIVDPSLVFAGAEAIVSININSYNKPMNKGVTAYLGGVMITGNIGPLGRIDGRPSVDQMFEDVAADGQIDGQATQPIPSNVTPIQQPVPHQMTATATGTYEQMVVAGWSDKLLIEHGYMVA